MTFLSAYCRIQWHDWCRRPNTLRRRSLLVKRCVAWFRSLLNDRTLRFGLWSVISCKMQSGLIVQNPYHGHTHRVGLVLPKHSFWSLDLEWGSRWSFTHNCSFCLSSKHYRFPAFKLSSSVAILSSFNAYCILTTMASINLGLRKSRVVRMFVLNLLFISSSVGLYSSYLYVAKLLCT